MRSPYKTLLKHFRNASTPKLLKVLALLSSVPGATLSASATFIDLSQPLSSSFTPNGAYWDFNGGTLGTSSPGTVTDGSGNGYNGTLLAGAGGQPLPSYVQGRFGTALSFQANSDTLQAPRVHWDGTAADATRLDMANTSFAGGGWLNLSAINSGAAQRIYLFERGVSLYSGSGNFISFIALKSTNNLWALQLRMGNGESIVEFTSSARTTAFNDLNTWNHLGFIYELGDTSNVLRFYVNGLQLGDDILTNFAPAATTLASERQLTVGERNTATYQSNFTGAIDDVFLSSGSYTYAIPEPHAALLLLPALGGFVYFSRRRGNFRS